MRTPFVILLFILFIAVTDLYFYRGIHHLLEIPPGSRGVFMAAFWGATLVMFVLLFWAGAQFQKTRDPSRSFTMMVVVGIFLMLYIPRIFFDAVQLAGDLVRLVAGFISERGIPGRRWYLLPGAAGALLLFLGFGYGMAFGRTHLKLTRETVPIAGLPAPFSGLRIVQLSDFHLGGFYHHPSYIDEVVERVNNLKPDLILFTGDMVHNFAEELDPFISVLGRLQAPMGKFAILGNHDYGHYVRWKDENERDKNLENLVEKIREAGFDLLLNEHRTLSIDSSVLEIIGVENWGKPPFPQRGDLQKAMEGTVPGAVRILLSHDPSHWDLQIRGREKIALTLSGHTHGMQFGIELGNFRWSPSRWTYRNWAGMYHENGQYLYVNRGVGFTAYPGRVGIRPEITLLTLAVAPHREVSPAGQEP